MNTPSFALVGAVNHGKSSIAATLVERGNIGVSADPGMTEECQKIKHHSSEFVLWDTPGFQDPRTMLAKVGPQLTESRNPLTVLQQFCEKYASTDQFEAECKVCSVLCEEPAILYVIDSSKPLRKIHEAEMELLMLTGLQRLAILNPTADPEHEAEWRAKLGQRFGVVATFNAHQARVEDRVALVRTLATVVDKWRDDLSQIADEIESDWSHRINESAHSIVDLLRKSIGHTSSVEVARGKNKQPLIKAAKSNFHSDLQEKERLLHGTLQELFLHEKVGLAEKVELTYQDDLFSDETWRVFGLPWWVIVSGGVSGGAVVGGGAGAKIGAGGEIAMPSSIPLTLCAVTGVVVGGVGGGVAAMYVGKSVAQPAVTQGGKLAAPTLSPKRNSKFWRVVKGFAKRTFQKSTGTTITIGPIQGKNFAYVLLDRAIGLVVHLAHRTHAMTGTETLHAEDIKKELDARNASADHWPKDLSDRCETVLKKTRKKTVTPADLQAFEDQLARHIKQVLSG
jgi:predicted GTPase